LSDTSSRLVEPSARCGPKVTPSKFDVANEPSQSSVFPRGVKVPVASDATAATSLPVARSTP